MNRIKKLRQEFNITQNKLCEQLGITQGALSGWENERYEPDLASLKKLAQIFNTSIDYILGHTNERSPETTKPTAVKIPVLGRVAAGIPIDAIEEIIDYEEIPPDMAKRGKLIGLQIKGSSMEPQICNGDIVIIKCQDYIDDNHIGIVMVNGCEATCKKIKFSSSGITLISLNPAFEPIFYSNEEIENLPVRIFGEVIELRRKF